MIINAYKDGDIVTYYPEYAGNRELDDADKIEVDLCPITQKLKAKFNSMLRLSADKKNKGEFKTNAAEVTRATLIHCVHAIRNLQGRMKDGSIKDIKNGADLHDLGDPDLVEEILNAIQDRSILNEGLKKV